MRKHRTSLIALLTAASLTLLSACGSSAQPAQSPDTAQTIAETEEEASPEAATQSSETAQEPEKNGDIVILYTGDVHCGIDQGFGYAGLQQIRDYLIAQGDEVLLADTGDSIQGEPIGTMTKGEIMIDLMNRMGFAVAIPGNHEFDYGMDQFLSLTEKADFPYISCNFCREDKPVFPAYRIFELAGKKIGFVGVTTPNTLITSTPRYFQNEKGEYIYGFLRDDSGKKLCDAVQSAVDAAKAEGAEHVIVLAHMGDESEGSPWTYADVIGNTGGFEVMLDAHSHDTVQDKVKNREGQEVLRSACGSKLANIGWCRISADGEITTGLYTWNNKTAAPELLGIDNEMAEAVASATEELDRKLDEVVAKTKVDLIIHDPTEKDSSGKPVRVIRRMETNLGDLCADAYRDQAGADIAFVNGGGIRAGIDAGDVTLGDILSIHPFGNGLCVIEVTGQQILDALEWGAHDVPNEYGGFIQVSGLSYEINSATESSCVGDEKGMFVRADTSRRVENVKVGEEPIDPNKTYTLAGHSYMLLERGDGFTMFDNAPLLQDRVQLDNQVLINYITDTLGGEIGAAYENPYGQGRITIK
ncbi:MAG: bifunctional metallophosphatase/5'-nucleotidase [Lachnospiraceae bacterium]|nr:bifunctional metallophosphatase/5'-nucleotidase [Lachnospiraceae bacterium]